MSAALLKRDRVSKILMVADVVESVRLMERNEEQTIQRWHALVEAINTKVLAAHQGRMLKSLGDGLMLEFQTPMAAISAGFAIQALAASGNAGYGPQEHIELRAGIHITDVVTDEHDIYGVGVNLTARITTLAGPGEIVITDAIRDQIIADVDAEIEDLGEAQLKHVAQPVHVYRVGPPGPQPVLKAGDAHLLDLRPSVAVIPFSVRTADPGYAVLGEMLAEEIIGALARTPELHVISRLSTSAMRDRALPAPVMGAHLGVAYVVSGSCTAVGSKFRVVAELADARSDSVIWSEPFLTDVPSILASGSEVVHRIAAAAQGEILKQEMRLAVSQPLPTLEGYSLLMGAIGLMHKLGFAGFQRSRELLEELIVRAPRRALPHAWLGKWYVLRVQQGWTDDAAADGRMALQCTRRAMDLDGDCSIALAIDGLVHTNLLKRFDIAEARYDSALRANPNDSLAWLLKGTLHAFKGDGAQAVTATERALRLSPLDPMRYFYDSLAATAALSAGRHERAIRLARRSLKANRTHASTWRVLAISQVETGHMPEARKTAEELMRIDPDFTVSQYLARNPSAAFETGKIWATALRLAGIPE